VALDTSVSRGNRVVTSRVGCLVDLDRESGIAVAFVALVKRLTPSRPITFDVRTMPLEVAVVSASAEGARDIGAIPCVPERRPASPVPEPPPRYCSSVARPETLTASVTTPKSVSDPLKYAVSAYAEPVTRRREAVAKKSEFVHWNPPRNVFWAIENGPPPFGTRAGRGMRPSRPGAAVDVAPCLRDSNRRCANVRLQMCPSPFRRP
jgi:hypothetical protein